MSCDVVCSGYCSLDRVVRIDQPAQPGRTSLVVNHDNATIRFGGCNVNISVDLTRLGIKALPIIRTGYDYESSGFKQYLDQEKIDTSAIVSVKDAATSACYLIESPKLDHMTLFYPGAMSEVYFKNYQDQWFEKAKFTLMTVADIIDNREFARLAKKHQIPLLLGMKMDIAAFPPIFIKELIHQLRGIFCNETENAYLCECLGVTSNAELLQSFPNIDFILTTLGSQGSEIYYRKERSILYHKTGIVPAQPYVDSVGSGDGYIAGFIYGQLCGYDYQKSMELGATLATFVIEGQGATTGAPTLPLLLERHQKAFLNRKESV